MKCNFITDPVCKPHGNTGFIELDEDFFFTVDGIEYGVPKGYWFDGASIPRAFWWIMGSPFEPDFWAGAAAHDWIYLTHLIPRNKADEIIRQFFMLKKVAAAKARIVWGAVRSFAWAAWKNNAADQICLLSIIQALRNRPDRDRFHFAELSRDK